MKNCFILYPLKSNTYITNDPEILIPDLYEYTSIRNTDAVGPKDTKVQDHVGYIINDSPRRKKTNVHQRYLNKLWYIHIRCYTAMKINEIHYCYMHHVGAPDNIISSKRSQHQRNTV